MPAALHLSGCFCYVICKVTCKLSEVFVAAQIQICLQNLLQWELKYYIHVQVPLTERLHIFPHLCILRLQIKQTQDEEKKQLTALRDLIKSSLQLDQKEVGRYAARHAHP